MKEPGKPIFKSLFGLVRGKSGEQVSNQTPLLLHIPVPFHAGKRSASDVEQWLTELTGRSLKGLPLLVETNNYLQRISPLSLTTAKRMNVTDTLVSMVAETIGDLIMRLLHGVENAAQSRDLKDQIFQAIQVAEQLGISYKLIFSGDYTKKRNDEVLTRLTKAAIHIFEMCRLEQLLRAFRYQKTPAHIWSDCNQIYFAMRQHVDPQVFHRLKLALPVAGNFNSGPVRAATFEQLYLLLQITGLLDVASWPTPLMYGIGAYIQKLKQPLKIYEDALEEAVPVEHVIVYRNQGEVPSYVRRKNEWGEALLIDLRPLVRYASADLAALSSGKNATISPALKELPEHNRTSFLDLLLYKLHPQQRRGSRQIQTMPRYARLYGGFEPIYRLFQAANTFGVVNGADNGSPNGLSGSSRVVADVANAFADEPRWLIANEGEGGIQLRVHEGEYGLSLQVGRLVAYSLSDENKLPKLGYIVRLQREGDYDLEVAIARLAGDVAAVTVENLDTLNQRTLTALLLHSADGRLRLLCDNSSKMDITQRVQVFYAGTRRAVMLKSSVLSRPDFTLYELQPAT